MEQAKWGATAMKGVRSKAVRVVKVRPETSGSLTLGQDPVQKVRAKVYVTCFFPSAIFASILQQRTCSCSAPSSEENAGLCSRYYMLREESNRLLLCGSPG